MLPKTTSASSGLEKVPIPAPATSLCRSPKVYGGWFELFQDFATKQFFTVAYFETGESACLARISKENAERFYLDCGGEEASDYFA